MPDFCPRQARATDPSQAEPVEATEAAEAAADHSAYYGLGMLAFRYESFTHLVLRGVTFVCFLNEEHVSRLQFCNLCAIKSW